VIPREFSDWLSDPNRKPLVMGVLNVTPDSFSDGGRFATTDAAVAQAEAMVAAGADVIDVGGESTRPGALPVAANEQIKRVVPVIGRIANLPVTISIDTMRAAVAEAALEAGAAIVNDISAGRDDAEMLPLVARRRVPVVLMHMQGTPQTMQDAPSYRDVVAETSGFLRERVAAAQAVGIELSKILLDPGIGFGKKMPHNLELLRRQVELKRLGRPLVIGTSRKKFIGTITGEAEPSGRVMGTAASVAFSVANGADVVRVHDVAEMARVVRMIRAIQVGDVEPNGTNEANH
jgi:dihydropteroate synthase